MGNSQEKHIDLLDAYIDLQGNVFNTNLSECEDIIKMIFSENITTSEMDNLNYTVYAKCFNNTIPSALINQPYILPWYQQLLWTLVFAFMILVAIVGNLIVIWIIVAHRRMRTVTNFFLLNLAVADFLLAAGNAAFNFVFMLNSHWPFGGTFCVVSNCLANLTVSTSVFTILAMSLDRFVAVTRPLRPRMTKTLAFSIICLVWSLSAILSVPSVLYATTITYKYVNQGQRTLCLLVWPDGEPGKSYADHVYNIIFFIVTYVIPMVCMAFTYTWVGCILWGSKVIGENSDRQNEVVKAKQRVVHMLVAIMLLFAVCWLPYHIYFLYTYYHKDILQTHFIQHVYLAIYWLAMSNSCYNPIVYYIMNARTNFDDFTEPPSSAAKAYMNEIGYNDCIRFRGYFQGVMCLHGRSLKPVETAIQTPRSVPLMARTSVMTSNRTRSYKLSMQGCRKQSQPINSAL